MKKTLLVAFLMASTAITFGQTVNFGIKAGLNMSELHRSQTNYVTSSFLPGFNVGGIVDIGFQSFSIQPGLFYSSKGEQIVGYLFNANQLSAGKFTANNQLNYIEVPVNFLYKIKIAPSLRLQLGGGPYIGYGISEVINTNDNSTALNFNSSHKYLYNNPDYGINFIVGIRIKNKFIIDGGYALGLANLASNSYVMQNRVISFSVGYLFR
jgi:hypothetical protein